MHLGSVGQFVHTLYMDRFHGFPYRKKYHFLSALGLSRECVYYLHDSAEFCTQD